jgi:hypothetical protein
MTAGGQLAHHDFAVDKIFGATEAYETDFQKGKPDLILANDSIPINMGEWGREDHAGNPGRNVSEGEG